MINIYTRSSLREKFKLVNLVRLIFRPFKCVCAVEAREQKLVHLNSSTLFYSKLEVKKKKMKNSKNFKSLNYSADTRYFDGLIKINFLSTFQSIKANELCSELIF